MSCPAREPPGGEQPRITLPRAARGAGEPITHGKRSLFIPPSRESILDLNSKEVFDRKLPASERAARRTLRTLCHRATAAWQTLFAWIVTHPERYAAANVEDASEPLQRLCQLHPRVRAPLLEACERAKTGDAEQRRRAKELIGVLGS